MRFRSDSPIFQQIVEHLEEQVIRGELLAEERVPAVRDFALEVEVNPNTVMRSFLELEEAGVFFKKRGLGYFLSPDAKEKILRRRKKHFLDRELPEVVRTMHLLGVGIEVVMSLFQEQVTAQKDKFDRKTEREIRSKT